VTVNGILIDRQSEIRPGDVVELGGTELRLVELEFLDVGTAHRAAGSAHKDAS
jgi:hypothetical protein